MASFAKQLEQLLAGAQARGVLDGATAARLTALATERERERAVLSLGGTLGRLGAGATILGISLLIAANWNEISAAVKIAVLLLLLGGAHGAGLWIQWTERPYPRFAEALHFIGAGLFFAGIALVGQIYHLPSNLPGAVLLWLVAIAPLAVLLRSPAIAGLAVFAAWLWLHVAAADKGSALETSGFTAYLVLSVGMGLALLGAQSRLPPADRRIRLMLRSTAQLMLFYGVYMLGFFRRYVDWADAGATASMVLPLAALGLGVAGLAIGGTRLAPEVPWLRSRLVLLLVLVAATSLAALLVDFGVLARGPVVPVFEFGSEARFTVATILISATAWILWFLLALWLVAYGALSRLKDFVNLGVLGFGLGVITRFLDLIGGLAETGTLFVLGGVVLLGTAWAMERWRRGVVARMETVP